MAKTNRKERRRIHVIKRARERYDLRLEHIDVITLGTMIRLGLGRPITNRVHRGCRKVFVSTVGGDELPVVYNNEMATIVTVLPPEAKEVVRARVRRAATLDR